MIKLMMIVTDDGYHSYSTKLTENFKAVFQVRDPLRSATTLTNYKKIYNGLVGEEGI